ncbi:MULTISPECIES: DUF1800 family protein [unclassified Rhizobacter]|uniref:DUF1800 domain-containing protein n=1 Tax=unclassified Rhizobacter TaxID=2640088 RepID=UPI0006F79798|nr:MULTISPECIES: DUF1800 domain-containing protein [unclassified Rhizobacter]KQU81054.1 hypothetical protein ASC88_16140 [Rhizobacter sp. Root29]KQW04598.1 hypothetical protein ASC98_05830 [Rhizobacter sp. Root1238]KRB06441.1 hypothetical protein ASE08_12390 [Rhizobacter sp. Root16D2]
MTLNESDARHLLTRTGFAPSPQQLAPWVGLSAEAAVDRLIDAARAARFMHPPPDFTREPIRTPLGQLPDDDARKAARQQARRDTLDLAAWWLQEMRDTPAPLAERMVLFWHNHFATSVQKVQNPQGMFIQQQLFRTHALGSFSELLHGIARDPAMLIYLDGAANKAQAPNENFAREVMELFTLGEGQYREQDIKEAARAFSGWTVDRADWSARPRPRLHDGGSKTLLGRSAAFDSDGALDQMLAQPAAARFIAGKLWREFVSPVPEAAALDRVAARLRDSGWRIDAALRELLLADAFWAPATRAALIKSPVELTVGTLRQFDVQLDSMLPIARASAKLGQSLFVPPNVKGWPGYTNWIDSTTLLERKRFTERLFRGVEMGNGGLRFDADAWLSPLGAHADREPDAATKVRIEMAVLAAPPVNPLPAGTVGLSMLRALSLDPAFQLK